MVADALASLVASSLVNMWCSLGFLNFCQELTDPIATSVNLRAGVCFQWTLRVPFSSDLILSSSDVLRGVEQSGHRRRERRPGYSGEATFTLGIGNIEMSLLFGLINN